MSLEDILNRNNISINDLEALNYEGKMALVEKIRSNKEVMMILIEDDYRSLEYASDDLKNDKDIVMAAVKSSSGRALQYSSDEGVAMMNTFPGRSAVDPNCTLSLEDILNRNNISRDDFEEFMKTVRTFKFATPAHEKIQSNKGVMTAAAKRNGLALHYACDDLKNDKDVVMAAVERYGIALQYASDDLKNDKDVVMIAVKRYGIALKYASDELKYDKDIVIAAVKRDGYALGYASDELKNDKDIVMAAVKRIGGWALQHASDELKNDKDIVMAAVKTTNDDALRYASDELKNDKDIVMAAVERSGKVLEYASDELKGNREIVLGAVENYPEAIQYAGMERNEDGSPVYDKDGNQVNLNQDPEVLAAAGLFDKEDVTIEYDRRVVMSVRFSQGVDAPRGPMLATLEMKKHPFFRDSFIHFPNVPNAFNNGSLLCEDACNGTDETCQAPGEDHEDKIKNCWKYSYNNQLEKCNMSNGPHPGYMVQIINPLHNKKTHEDEWMGEGQKEELLMAKNNGVKVFQSYEEDLSNYVDNTYTWAIGMLVEAIEVWDESDGNDMRVVRIDGKTKTVELLDFSAATSFSTSQG